MNAAQEAANTARSAERPADLESAARHELAHLWDDLLNARRAAINGVWSMRCDDVVWRIGALTVLVGPTPWEEISWDLLLDNTYQAIHEVLGVDAPVDMDRVREGHARWQARQRSMRP